MSLTKRSESPVIFLQAKHFCLWQELKSESPGCETIQVTNPKTGDVITKHGHKFDTVEGLVTDAVKYDTEKKYPTRYFGFKLKVRDGIDEYSVDMPYTSQLLRRFLSVAPNVNWAKPLSITVFKGKKKDGKDDATGIWFRQEGETVKPYFTKEAPHGMPAATFDADLQQWDFKPQHRWLVARFQETTIPDIRDAAKTFAPPMEPHIERSVDEAPPERDMGIPPCDEITDDDVPF